MISVIIPVYNVAQYLEECVQSVINQTYMNIEIILIDDGSTDSSGIICDKLQKMDNRIFVIHKKNGGLSSARNAGIDKARGKYLFFLDSDDRLPLNALEILHNNIEKNNADICIGNYIRFDTEDIDAKTNVDWNTPKIYSGEDVIDIYLNYGGYFVVAWNKLYRKELFNDTRYPNGKIHEDEFVAFDLWMKSKKIVCIPDEVYNYRYSPNSIMNQKLKINRLDSIEAYCLRIDKMKNMKKKDAVDKVLYILWKDVQDKFYKINYKENADRMIQLYKLLRLHFLDFIKCNGFSIKEKLAITVFLINFRMYQKIWC